MKKSLSLLTGILGFTALVAFTPVSDSDGYYAVNSDESEVKWTGSKITGSSHMGTVKISEGGIQVAGGKVSGGKFTIDMTSINVTDLDGSMKQKLEGHLKNEDFFNVEKFKTARLEITGVDGDNINANLTIKDKTHPVTFPAKVVMNADGSMTATAKIEVDRAKYDVRYGSDSFFDNLGDKTINDIIEFEVKIVGKAS
jgi:polyisoprenoid-binding protein YceI